MTKFRVIIGEHAKESKDLEISEAIEILSSIKAVFKNNTIGKKTAYSLRFGDLVDGSSDIVFYVDTDNEDNLLKIVPSHELVAMCLNDFKTAKNDVLQIIKNKKRFSGLKKFFSTTRQIKYDVKVQTGDNKNDYIIFTQEDSIKIHDKFNQETGIQTCLCSAEVFAIDVIKRKIGLKITESKFYDTGEKIEMNINQMVVDYCIKHRIQIGDNVDATTEVETKNAKHKHRLLNIYSENIQGLKLYD